jgi:sugar lactone lactonase YvrE
MRLTRIGTILAALGLWLGAAAVPAGAAPSPDCAHAPTPKVIYSGQGLLESVIVGPFGRLYFTSTPAGQSGRLMKVDRPGATPRVLVDGITGPGGMVFHGFRLLLGFGDTAANGVTGDANPQAGLYSVNPITGAKRVFATGLGMANGVARGPDGAIYASNDFGMKLDRVYGGVVNHGWDVVNSANGLVVDRAGRYLYAAQTFQAPAIARIEIANPSNVTTFAAGTPEDGNAILDGMTRDHFGNLYVAANLSGQIWRVDRLGRICVLARGLTNPSAVAFGHGFWRFHAGDLYAVTFGGDVVRLPGAAFAHYPG